jgi:hypothetical protein
MESKTFVVTHEPLPALTALTGRLQGDWWGMKDLAKTHPSRDLSLAITKAQEALMWLVECSHNPDYHVPVEGAYTAIGPDETEALVEYWASQLGKLNKTDEVESLIRSTLNRYGVSVE